MIQQDKQSRKRHIPARLQLNDASCKPGLELMDRIACRRPDPEALAIQAAWAFRFPVTIVDHIEDNPVVQLVCAP